VKKWSRFLRWDKRAFASSALNSLKLANLHNQWLTNSFAA
jgi:hypothetical protein